MKYLKNISILAVALFFSTMNAQQQANYNLYRYTMNAINPAYAGANTEKVEFTSHIKSYWNGLEGAPETQTFNLSAPSGRRIGLGFSVVNNKVFVENETDFYVDVSYRLQLSESTDVYLGLKAGGSTYGLRRGALKGFNINVDPALFHVSNKFRPNVGIGAYLKKENYYVALSIPKLLNSRAIAKKNDQVVYSKTSLHAYLSGGYNFWLSNIELRPSFMLQYAANAPLSAEFTAAAKFAQKLELGASYRTDNAFAGLLTLEVFDWLTFGYAYETTTRNEILKVSSGTHEFLVRFRL